MINARPAESGEEADARIKAAEQARLQVDRDRDQQLAAAREAIEAQRYQDMLQREQAERDRLAHDNQRPGQHAATIKQQQAEL